MKTNLILVCLLCWLSIKAQTDSITLANNKFIKSKAGSVYKFGLTKGLYWTNEDCKKVVKKKIWIGMNIWMVVYERGEPQHFNSFYDTNQSCWEYKEPNCFYYKKNNIVIKYE